MPRLRLFGFAMAVGLAMATPCLAQTPECSDGISTRSTRCGTDSTALGTDSTAVGNDAHVVGEQSTVVGARAGALVLNGSGATAVGAYSVAAGRDTTAIGRAAAVGSTLPGDAFPTAAEEGTAIGASAQVLANAHGGTALGVRATAGASSSTALGTNATAGFSGSTAIGFDSETQRANQIMLGRAGTSVTVGDIAASTSAQIGPVALMTVDATGTIGHDTGTISAINGSLAGLAAASTTQGTLITALQNADSQQTAQIASLASASALQARQVLQLQDGQAVLFDLAKVNRRDIHKANEGIAMALAMESPGLPAGTSFALSGGIGYFQGRTAATTAVSARMGERSALSAGVGVGFDSGEVGARAGFQVAW